MSKHSSFPDNLKFCFPGSWQCSVKFWMLYWGTYPERYSEEEKTLPPETILILADSVLWFGSKGLWVKHLGPQLMTLENSGLWRCQTTVHTPSLLPSLSPGGEEVCLALYSQHNALHRHGHRALGLSSPRVKPLNAWAKTNSSSFHPRNFVTVVENCIRPVIQVNIINIWKFVLEPVHFTW